MNKLITPVVFTDEQGQHQIMTGEGNVLRCIMTQVTDKVNEIPIAVVEMHVKLATNRDHAKELIKDQYKIY